MRQFGCRNNFKAVRNFLYNILGTLDNHYRINGTNNYIDRTIIIECFLGKVSS